MGFPSFDSSGFFTRRCFKGEMIPDLSYIFVSTLAELVAVMELADVVPMVFIKGHNFFLVEPS